MDGEVEKTREMDDPYGFQDPSEELFPPIVMLDITNVCNGKCLHCPQKDVAREGGYEPAYLEVHLFEKLMKEVSNYKPKVVRITADGEPMLHPEIFTLLECAKRYRVEPVNLTTNGSLLSEEALEEILRIGVDVVDVSLDAFSVETYAKIRAGLDFHKVVENVHRLLERRDPGRTKVMVSIIRMDANEAELDDFVRYWQERVDKVLVRSLHSNRNFYDHSSSPEPSPQRYPCPHLWKRLILDYRGRIKFCPVDWQGDSVVGDFRETSLQDVWKSPRMEHYRALHKAGEFSRIPFCGDCQDWKTSPWDHGYEKAVGAVFRKGSE